MYLPEHFDRFRENLSSDETRRGRIESAVSNFSAFVAEDVLGDLAVGKVFYQGSYAHRTVTRPVREEQDYDIDVVLPVDATRVPKARQPPAKFLAYVKSRLDTWYRGTAKVTQEGCCTRINYAGDFHLDLVPAHRGTTAAKPFLVPDRRTGEWRPTNPPGYTAWFESASAGRSNFLLRPATKAFKRWKDLKFAKTTAPKSIVLTTLLGWFNPGQDLARKSKVRLFYAEHPTTSSYLVDCINLLHERLAQIPNRPPIWNPSLPAKAEDLARNWTQENYDRFRDRLGTLSRRTTQAFLSRRPDTSVKLFRECFGEAFPTEM